MYVYDGLELEAPLGNDLLGERSNFSDKLAAALASGQWYLALTIAIIAGQRDENQLTNLIFFAQHPGRGGRKLDRNEPDYATLSQEWLRIRNNIVRPALKKFLPTPPSAPSPARTRRPRKSWKKNAVAVGLCVATEKRLHTAPPPTSELVPVPTDLEFYKWKKNRLDRQALQAYQQLVQAARAAGIRSPYLKLNSSYRDYDNQAQKWKVRLLEKFENLGCPKANLPCLRDAITRTNAALRNPARENWPLGRNAWLQRFLKELARGGCDPVCDPKIAVAKLRRGTAPPGSSPHHTGRALDIHVGGKISTKKTNVAFQKRNQAYQWLVCNAARFNFYPYAPEPWHWEYNPA